MLLTIGALEARDGYFSSLETLLEGVYNSQGRGSVLLGHSNGNQVIQYFLRWIEGKNGRDWIDKHIYGFMAVGGPFLGSSKGLRCVSTGDRMGLELFLTESDLFYNRDPYWGGQMEIFLLPSH